MLLRRAVWIKLMNKCHKRTLEKSNCSAFDNSVAFWFNFGTFSIFIPFFDTSSFSSSGFFGNTKRRVQKWKEHLCSIILFGIKMELWKVRNDQQRLNLITRKRLRRGFYQNIIFFRYLYTILSSGTFLTEKSTCKIFGITVALTIRKNAPLPLN